jgi:hypothetical protein
MKKLFCVVVTDPDYVIGLDSPIIFHVRCKTLTEAEEFVDKELSLEDYGYDPDSVENLDIFTFEVIELDIQEV